MTGLRLYCWQGRVDTTRGHGDAACGLASFVWHVRPTLHGIRASLCSLITTRVARTGAAGELEINGRALRVDYSTPRPPRDESGGFGGRYVFHSPALLTAQWWSRGWSRRLWRPRRTRARIVRRRSRRTGSRQLRSRARPGLGLRGTRPWGSARQPAQLGRHPGRRRQQEDLRLAWLARRVACSLSFPRTCATSSSVLHAFYTV